jgi:hypothetical protein
MSPPLCCMGPASSSASSSACPADAWNNVYRGRGLPGPRRGALLRLV